MKMAQKFKCSYHENDMEIKTYVIYHDSHLIVYIHFKIVFKQEFNT